MTNSTRLYADKVAVICATTETRTAWSITSERAERAIRAARRQVQRYGDEARQGLLSWCKDDAERELVSRALDTSTRIGTIVKEWDVRTADTR